MFRYNEQEHERELASWQGIVQREMIERLDQGTYKCRLVWAKRRNHLMVNVYTDRTLCGVFHPMGIIGEIENVCEGCAKLYRETFLLWLESASQNPAHKDKVDLIKFTIEQYPDSWHYYFING